ncbi:MAG TPA: hypothetical protein VF814_20895 [Casimicrobiaceae bacterium]
MVGKGLDLQQAPPISVPLRFFITAPAFALLAALVTVWQGAEVFQSRWAPATLAVTHLLVLGCVTMVMVGALMQIMPVLAGAPFARPRAIASIVHPALSLGTLALAGGFLTGERTLLAAATVLLGSAFAVFVAAMAHALSRATATNATVRTLWLVAAALAIAVALGAWLASSRGWSIPLFVASLPDVHPGWALLGWVGLLVVAVAHRVVPMFQLTPNYPDWMPRRFGWAVLAALTAWSAATEFGGRVASIAGAVPLAMLYATFAATTLRLQRRRRRRQLDVNVLFWRAGMLCAIGAVLGWIVSLSSELPSGFTVAVGVLAVVGAALSLVNGMLYRIVPFLAWFHLYTRAGASPHVPHLKDYLADGLQRRQLWLHIASIALLVAATLWPPALARVAAVVLAASALQWLLNLLAIVRVYTRHVGAIALSQSPQRKQAIARNEPTKMGSSYGTGGFGPSR